MTNLALARERLKDERAEEAAHRTARAGEERDRRQRQTGHLGNVPVEADG